MKQSEKKERNPIDLDIEKQEFHSFYLLYGEEGYLKKGYRDKIKSALLPDNDQMNYSYFEGEDPDILKISETAQTLPFFQNYRVIVIENGKLFEKANDLVDYLPGFSDSTIVIFLEEKVDKRNKLYKYIQKKGVVIECGQLDNEKISQWIVAEIAKRGHVIRRSTANYFLEHIDHSMATIDQEIQKVLGYTEGRKEITIQDIDAICSFEITENIFQMTDAIADGDVSTMLLRYHEMVELQANVMRILTMVVRHFNILLQIKDLGNSVPPKTIASAVKVHPFFVKKYQMQCRRFTKEELRKNLSRCVEFECAFKSGKIDDKIGLEMLLVEIIGKK